MAASLEPFTGYLPTAEFAHRIVGPPSASLSKQARKAAAGDTLSFRHSVGKGAGVGEANARAWLHETLDSGALAQVGPALLVYRQTAGEQIAEGLIADVSIASYDSGFVKKHETTIAKSERRMAKYMAHTRIHGNPVVLAHRPHAAIATIIAAHVDRNPDLSIETADGNSHEIWIVPETESVAFCDDFADLLYITDGHHRLAAASSVATAEGRTHPHLPAGMFSTDQLQLRTFSRTVKDSGLNAEQIIARLETFDPLEVTDPIPRPAARHQAGVRVGGRSFVITYPERPGGVYHQLDATMLQDLVLEPVFDIHDPRQDPRLSFAPDHPSATHNPDDYDAWFLPYAATTEEVLEVADSGMAMPPKSTWFAPKLPGGLVIRPMAPNK